MHSRKLFLIAALAAGGILTASTGQAHQDVRVADRHLLVDFDQDGVYTPFFVKGVGYAPVPIGHFIGRGDGWSADCRYVGPVPLNFPDQRFSPESPDANNAFVCGANGSGFYDDTAVLRRDFTLLQGMNANTIRTWSQVTFPLLDEAEGHGLKVIAGFWIDHNLDFTFPGTEGAQQRQAIVDDFRGYVRTFKHHPAVLSWGISNENNLHFCNSCAHGDACNPSQQAAGFYTLVNDLAKVAKQEEGADAHPAMVVVAELGDTVAPYVWYLPDVEIIGVNAYRGKGFDGYPKSEPDLFELFDQTFRSKALVITEFGVDAWNSGGDPEHPEQGFEDQNAQQQHVISAWDDIVRHAVTAGGNASGGVVFHYSDNWNGYGEPYPQDACTVSSDWTPSVITHDHNYTDPEVFGIGVFPDDKQNPEWWGIMRTGQSPDGGIDTMTPRKVYHALKERFTQVVSGEATPWLDGSTGRGVTHKWGAVRLPGDLADPVVIVGLGSFYGGNTAGLRIKDVGSSGFKVFVEEEASRDRETGHTKEDVHYLATTAGAVRDDNGEVVGEAGRISASQPDGSTWHTVHFEQTYAVPPVVLMNMVTFNGRQPAHIRLRQVTKTAFQYQIEEWDYLDQGHTTETMHYVALLPGTHVIDGNHVLAAQAGAVNHSWRTVSLAEGAFSAASVATVIAQAQTANDASAVVTRLRNISYEKFDLRVQEEEGSDNAHGSETVGFIAVERPLSVQATTR